MSVSQSAAFIAIANQLLAELEAYEVDMGRLVASPADSEAYRVVSCHMDSMRMYAAALPQVAVAWVELLIRHFELTHGLWRAQQGHTDPEDIRKLHRDHHAAADVLRARCMAIAEAR